MPTVPFDTFRDRALAAGADELIERRWSPGQLVETHTHPFEAEALVVEGEMWLTCDGETRHLMPGDEFHLAHGQPHAERYGPEGAVYWVARWRSR